MHYYKLNIADWQSATRHLTPEEEGVYLRLINYYYDTEKPIPTEIKPVIRRLCLSSCADVVQSILDEFFEKTDKGYRKEKCDEILKEYKKTSKKNQANGSKGGRPKRTKGSSETQTKPTGLILGSQKKPTGNPNQELETKNQELETKEILVDTESLLGTSKLVPCPHEKIIELYHEILSPHGCRQVKTWTDARQKFLKARWTEDKKRQDLDWWKRFFEYVTRCPFLIGKSAGDRPFFVDLEWLIKPSNFVKVIEGKYDA